jgi:hypothetical protein
MSTYQTTLDIDADQIINSAEVLIQNLTGAEFKFNNVDKRKMRTRFKSSVRNGISET